MKCASTKRTPEGKFCSAPGEFRIFFEGEPVGHLCRKHAEELNDEPGYDVPELTRASSSAILDEEVKGMTTKTQEKKRSRGRPRNSPAPISAFKDWLAKHGYTAESFAREATKKTGVTIKTNTVYKWRLNAKPRGVFGELLRPQYPGIPL